LISNVENLLGAAIVDFQLDDTRAREALGELEDIAEISAAEGVDALAVVAHHHHVAAAAGQELYYPVLHRVGVLVFVDHDVTIAALQFPPDGFVGFHEFDQLKQQIVEVHHAAISLELFVLAPDGFHLLDEFNVVWIVIVYDEFQRCALVHGLAEQLLQGLPPGEAALLEVDPGGGAATPDQFHAVGGIEDREVVGVFDRLGIPAQYRGGHRMESASFSAADISADQRRSAPKHLFSSPAGEGQQKHLLRSDSPFDHIRQAIDKSSGLTAARTCDHQDRPLESGDSLKLFVVQLVPVTELRLW